MSDETGVVGYGPEYDAAWEDMTKKPWAWGLAPIHHGCFENGWSGALEAAARLADPPAEDSMPTDEDLAVYAALGKVAAAIRALAVYDETPIEEMKPEPTSLESS